jgi:cytochrome P450
MREFTTTPLQFLQENARYGDFTLMWFGPYSVYVVNHPDYAHDVLVTHATQYYKDRVLKTVLKPVLGTGLFTNDGDFWKRQRKLVQPAFHSKRIGAYAQVMVDYAQELAQRWHDGATLDVDRDMTELTMRIVCKTLFDADVATQAHEVGEVITEVLKLTNRRFNNLLPIPDWLPTRDNRALTKSVARLDELIMGFIAEWRRTGEDKGDLLSMLLMAMDDDDATHMTDKQVRDEAMTLFGAGHETTAVTLTWAWYLLSQNPTAEARLHDELSRVLGGRAPTLADLPQLQYTEMVIKEAMRLYPPAFAVTRQNIEDVTIADYPIKKNSIVMVNIYGMHRDVRFFENPDQFRPERFSTENEKNPSKYAYLPFGGGPRVCIGNQFAMMEAKLVLATLAQRFQLSLAPGHQVVPERVFTLRPKYGLKMLAHIRESLAVTP